jgi:hypothetical protein
MKLTISKISFLKDIDPSIKVDMRTDWRHHWFEDFSVDDISSFLTSIGDEKIYLIIPLFSSSKDYLKPSLNLSEPFLVNNRSNPVLITKFLLEQWQSSGFAIYKGTKISLSFKWKRVWLF